MGGLSPAHCLALPPRYWHPPTPCPLPQLGTAVAKTLEPSLSCWLQSIPEERDGDEELLQPPGWNFTHFSDLVPVACSKNTNKAVGGPNPPCVLQRAAQPGPASLAERN